MQGRAFTRLKGHKAPVCCLATDHRTHALISGGEDGSICTFDVRSKNLISRIQLADADAAVPSVVLDPSDAHRLYCCTGSEIAMLDRRKEGEAECLWRQSFNSDEVNSISISSNGRLLTSSDDAGHVAVVDLEARSLVRRLQKGHSNIASSAVFHDDKSWQVVSGGLDCQLIRWDFSGDTVLQRFDIGREEGGQDAAQLCNPPMIHALACHRAAEHQHGSFVCAARGDGVVAVYSTAGGTKPRRKQSVGRHTPKSSAPIFAKRCHDAAVSCIWLPASEDGRSILSGGNDGKVVLQTWAETSNGTSHLEPQEAESNVRPATTLQHKRKINFVATNEIDLSTLYVADISRNISVYRLE